MDDEERQRLKGENGKLRNISRSVLWEPASEILINPDSQDDWDFHFEMVSSMEGPFTQNTPACNSSEHQHFRIGQRTILKKTKVAEHLLICRGDGKVDPSKNGSTSLLIHYLNS